MRAPVTLPKERHVAQRRCFWGCLPPLTSPASILSSFHRVESPSRASWQHGIMALAQALPSGRRRVGFCQQVSPWATATLAQATQSHVMTLALCSAGTRSDSGPRVLLPEYLLLAASRRSSPGEVLLKPATPASQLQDSFLRPHFSSSSPARHALVMPREPLGRDQLWARRSLQASWNVGKP